MSTSDDHHRVYRGDFVQTPSPGKLDIFEDYCLGSLVHDSSGITSYVDLKAVVNQQGFIISFERATGTLRDAKSGSEIVTIPKGSFVIPTFCDLHLHAPQYLYQGNGLDLPLMQWLDTYALKAEEQLDGDGALARRVYRKLGQRLAKNGTGTVLLFGTIKEDTNMILAEEMQNIGIRAFVGKLSMDISSRPTYMEASTQDSLKSARSFVSRCRALDNNKGLITPVLTPRFVPTCSNDLLEGLGRLSEEENVHVQSHLAEAHDEVEWVRKERGMEDIDVFDKYNLLTPRTVQAHCTFLSPIDLSRVQERGTSVAHCPLSNVYFSAEPFRLREALDRGVKVGLGTDIAGGYSADIMNAMRQAVAVSRMRQGSQIMEQTKSGGVDKNLAIDWKESLYLATRGGYISLGLNSGVFAAGTPFDAQIIGICDPGSEEGIGGLDLFGYSKINEEMVEKWWCNGDDRNRKSVWVQGRRVFEHVE